MLAVFLLLMFILQLFSFYIIALLYMKVSKFNDLEKKQQKLMSEMDDAIGAYLNELKEENDRLILMIDKSSSETGSHSELKQKHRANKVEGFGDNQQDIISINPLKYPMKVAMKSYQSSHPKEVVSVEKDIKEEKMDDRSVAIRMYDEGKTIEEIAKKLGKGKTEVELLLKFR